MQPFLNASFDMKKATSYIHRLLMEGYMGSH